MTALHTSRATLRRLVERQAELAAEVAKEQKQAARIEWLLNRVCGSCRRLAGQLVLFLECQGRRAATPPGTCGTTAGLKCWAPDPVFVLAALLSPPPAGPVGLFVLFGTG